jgi:hypothetical protein
MLLRGLDFCLDKNFPEGHGMFWGFALRHALVNGDFGYDVFAVDGIIIIVVECVSETLIFDLLSVNPESYKRYDLLSP